MTLQEALSAIKTAVYGEDVRNAILSGLGLCYSERLSGGYNPNDDLNNFINGVAFFDTTVENKPFNGSFLLAAGGNEDECCQVAIDPAGVNSLMIRHKESESWTTWSDIVETAVYQVRYYTYDGAEPPLYIERVSEGGNATWNGAPEKESSVQYDYIFLGWNLLPNQTEISEGALYYLSASVDVYAAYRESLRSYHVYFYNGSEPFDTQTVVYGGNATPPSTNPIKESSAQYHYSFIGWNADSGASTADPNALDNITGDKTVYAIYSSTVRSYTVSFRNGSTELQSVTVPYGGTAVYSGVTPTKEDPEGQYTYSFIGWSTTDGSSSADANATRNIMSDTILYAAFSTTVITYTVRFMNGVEPLETISVEYGQDAVYSGSTPEKEATPQYTYSFLGWNIDPNADTASASALRNVTTDRDVYAIYQAITRSYTVTFVNEGETITSVSVPYGSDAAYSGDPPTKASSAQYNYTFAGWNRQPNQTTVESDALSNIVGDRTVYSVYDSSVRTYIVRFIDDGTILETKDVPYGSDVTYTKAEPERADTEQYNYTFVGWNSSPNQTVKDDTVLQNIRSNRDIYAAYSVVIQTYVVSFCKDSIIKRASVRGTTTTRAMLDLYPCDIDFDGHISGWSEYLEYGKTYNIQFAANNNSNIILYIEDSNGSHSYTGNGTFYVEEGHDWCLWIEFAADTTFEDASFTISMTDGESDTNLMPLFAQYPTSAGRGELSVSWGPDVYDIQTVPYDSNVTYGGVTPTKVPTSEYRYTFIGWSEYEGQTVADSGALQNIRRNKTLYPAFVESSATVTVRFYYNSTLLETQTVETGSTVTYGGETPTKQSVAQYNYVFNGWSEEEDQTVGTSGILENVTRDLDLYPAFLPVVRTYTVRFLNGDSVLQTSQVAYGNDAVYSGEEPYRESSEQTSYTFVGWALQDGQSAADFSALMDITADRDIYAAFSATLVTYNVYFYNGSELLYTDTVSYGGNAAYSGDSPTKASTETYDYMFVGWNSQDGQTTAESGVLENITVNKTVYAAFVAKSKYTIGNRTAGTQVYVNEYAEREYDGTDVIDGIDHGHGVGTPTPTQYIYLGKDGSGNCLLLRRWVQNRQYQFYSSIDTTVDIDYGTSDIKDACEAWLGTYDHKTQNAFVPTTIYYLVSLNGTTTRKSETSRCFPLSVHEFGRTSYDPALTEGINYLPVLKKFYPGTTDAVARIGYIEGTSTAVYYWTRSECNSTNVYVITSDGTISNAARTSGFFLRPTIAVDPDTPITVTNGNTYLAPTE